MLIRGGHRVDVANNGIEAVNAVRNIPYDVILMDLGMPEMDGLTATRMIRAFTGDSADVPIIGVSSGESEIDQETCQGAGINEVVSKPVDPAELDAAIARQCVVRDETEESQNTPRHVPEITAEERRELKDLLASLNGIADSSK